ncbi:MAG TPA: bestrophin family ion channel [Chitinophagaceae bacterium]|nr:bestrophin family ion channel [Chitinophagaceae bacterium]
MHSGKSYRLPEFLLWTRRNMFWPFIVGALSTSLYLLLDFKWLAIPWPVVALLGTATAFIVGFKNLQTYNRTWEARQIWGAAMGASRSWATRCRDFINNSERSKELIYRHFAWLTALRYQLRVTKEWETTNKAYNREYKKFYTIPETEVSVEEELTKYISKEELQFILTTKNRAGQLLSLQCQAVKKLLDDGLIDGFRFLDMHNAVREFFDHQGRSERIKNFPYPRQYASINTFLVNLFCFLLPFGLLGEFDKLNQGMAGLLRVNMVWLVIPFTILVSWVYTSLDQVGESTENPFEGSANDVPISQMSRAVEIDMREMLGETDLPPALAPKNKIIL